MRLAALAAAIGGLAIASTSFGAFTFTTQRSVAAAGLERVVLFARGTGTGAASEDVFAADLSVSTPTVNGLKFSVTDTDDDGVPDSVNYLIAPAGVPTATRTRANNVVFGTLAPGFPVPVTNEATSPGLYQQGLNSFQIVGFDGRDATTTPDLGAKAGSDVNGGLGAAIFAAVVPTGSVVSFVGSIGSDVANSTAQPFAVVDPVPEPATLGALSLAALGLVRRRK